MYCHLSDWFRKATLFLAHRRTRRDLRIDDLPTEDDSCIVMCCGLIGLSRKICRRRIPWQQSANANAHWHGSSEGSCRNTHAETTSSAIRATCVRTTRKTDITFFNNQVFVAVIRKNHADIRRDNFFQKTQLVHINNDDVNWTEQIIRKWFGFSNGVSCSLSR